MYQQKGELDQALDYFKEALRGFEEMENKKKRFQGIKLTVMFLQGKIVLLELNMSDVKALFQQVAVESQFQGYNCLKAQCKSELIKLQDCSVISAITEVQRTERNQFQKHQLEDIIMCLEDTARRLQII